MLWHCWLGGRKGIRPVMCWRGYLSGARCRLAYGPADATASCLSKIQLLAHLGSPRKRAVKWVCVCVRACVCILPWCSNWLFVIFRLHCYRQVDKEQTRIDQRSHVLDVDWAHLWKEHFSGAMHSTHSGLACQMQPVAWSRGDTLWLFTVTIRAITTITVETCFVVLFNSTAAVIIIILLLRTFI